MRLKLNMQTVPRIIHKKTQFTIKQHFSFFLRYNFVIRPIESKFTNDHLKAIKISVGTEFVKIFDLVLDTRVSSGNFRQ